MHVPIVNTVSENYCLIMVLDISSMSTSVVVPVFQDSSHIQLPKIDLPKFNGSFTKWGSFCETFVSLVHEIQSVRKLERFHDLLTCVSGLAITVIKSIPLSAVNYDISWEVFIEQYDNQRLLATAHLEKLFSFRPISTESLSLLLTFENVFEQNITAIKALGVVDLAGFMFFFSSVLVCLVLSHDIYLKVACHSIRFLLLRYC